MHSLLQGIPSPGDTAMVRSTAAAAATAGEAVALSLAPDILAESPSACTGPSEPAACAEAAQAADQSAAVANAAHEPADSAATDLSASGAVEEAALVVAAVTVGEAAVLLNPYAEAQCVSIALSHSAAGAMVDLSARSAHQPLVQIHVAATVGQATATAQPEHVQAMTAELRAGPPASATVVASSVMDEAHCDDSSELLGNGTAALGQPLAAGLGCPTGEYPAMGTNPTVPSPANPTVPSPAKPDSTAGTAAPAEAAAMASVSTASVAVAAEVTADTSVTATAMGASLPDADAARRDALQYAVAGPAPLQLGDDSGVPRLTRSGVWLVTTTPSVCLE